MIRSTLFRTASAALAVFFMGATMSCGSSTEPGGGSPGVRYTLTIGVVGQGEVAPDAGSHRHPRDAVVELAATPAEGWWFAGWIGAVEDPASDETTITMADDHAVHAVFVTGDHDPPGETDGALCNLESEGEGFRALYEAWNCDGLEGVWTIRGELIIDDMDIFGEIVGEDSFTMPPRPPSGPWESAPFSWTMSGTIDAQDAVAEIVYSMQDVVVTIVELSSGPVLMDARGWGTAVGTVTVPDQGTFEVFNEFFEPAFVPVLVEFASHQECD